MPLASLRAENALPPAIGSAGSGINVVMPNTGFDATSPTFAENHWRLVLDEVEAFIYTTDLEGRYTFANRMVLELLGHPLEYVLGKDIGEFFDLSKDDSLRENDERVLRHGETIAREEANLIQATGEVRTYWSVKKPLRDAGGVIVGMIGISYEITQRKRLEAKVNEQNKLMDAILDNVDALVYMKDANRRFVYANERVAEVFGRPCAEIIGALDTDLMPREVADRFWEKDLKIFKTGTRQAGEETLVDAAGRSRHYWSVIVPWSSPDGTPAIIGLSTDITELHELKEDLQRQTVTDMLTGAGNRRGLYERARREFARCRRHGIALGLISIDIDHFKQVNDRYGHLAGDRVLREFAACCHGALRSEDLCARTGGEEFSVLSFATDLDATYALAERIRGLVAACLANPDDPESGITASFGVTCLRDSDGDFEAMFRRADRALYRAKQEGRNRTCVEAD
jgi:diguanylate cyclase (GGDEF)-like protein/PAS domain S-box-containing protein